jgi:hypothetical protein
MDGGLCAESNDESCAGIVAAAPQRFKGSLGAEDASAASRRACAGQGLENGLGLRE